MALEVRIEVSFGEEEGGNCERGHRRLLGLSRNVLRMFYFLMWVVVKWVCSLCGNALECMLYFIKDKLPPIFWPVWKNGVAIYTHMEKAVEEADLRWDQDLSFGCVNFKVPIREINK